MNRFQKAKDSRRSLREMMERQRAAEFADSTVSKFQSAMTYDGTPSAPKTDLYRMIVGDPLPHPPKCLHCLCPMPDAAKPGYCSEDCFDAAEKLHAPLKAMIKADNQAARLAA